MEFNKETLAVVGKASVKVGKAIIIEGTKAVAVKGVTAIIMDGFSVKDMTVDKFVSGGKVDGTEEKPKKEKKGFFKRKKKEDGESLEIPEEINIVADVEQIINKEETKED